MDIRRARASDLEVMQPLLDQLMRAPIDQRHAIWRDSLAHPGYTAWVAEANSALVGFIDLLVFPDVAHGCKVGVINNLVVDERFRGQGIGERLIREVMHYSKQRDAKELHVWTGFDNTRAIEFYRRVGFADRALLLEAEL